MDREYQKRRLEQIGRHLELTDETVALAYRLRHSYYVVDRSPGVNEDLLLGACLYLAVREHKIPIPPNDISDFADIPFHHMYRAMKRIKDKLHITLEPISTSKYVHEFIYRLDTEYDLQLGGEVADETISYIEVAKHDEDYPYSAPSSIAAAAIYNQCQRMGRGVTQKQLAEASNTSPLTVRKTAERLHLIMG